jgi:hypothetical protein
MDFETYFFRSLSLGSDYGPHFLLDTGGTDWGSWGVSFKMRKRRETPRGPSGVSCTPVSSNPSYA